MTVTVTVTLTVTVTVTATATGREGRRKGMGVVLPISALEKQSPLLVVMFVFDGK